MGVKHLYLWFIPEPLKLGPVPLFFGRKENALPFIIMDYVRKPCTGYRITTFIARCKSYRVNTFCSNIEKAYGAKYYMIKFSTYWTSIKDFSQVNVFVHIYSLYKDSMGRLPLPGVITELLQPQGHNAYRISP